MKSTAIFISCFSTVLLLLNTSTLVSQQNFWQQTNGPYGRVIVSISTTSDGTVLAAPHHAIQSGSKGIYRTTNNGASWNATGLSLDAGVFQIISPWEQYVFAAVDESAPLKGVHLSTDDGLTWSPTGLMNVLPRLAADSAGKLYAATFGTVYRSLDTGRTWQGFTSGLPSSDINDLATNQLGHIFAGAQSGVFRSTDQGAHWGLALSLSGFSCALGVKDDTTIFAGSSGQGIFRSTDGGNSWTFCGLAGRILSAFSFSHAGSIFVAVREDSLAGVYWSTNNGNTWIPRGLSTHNGVHSLNMKNGSIVFAGVTRGGVYRSEDEGQTWVPSGWPSTFVLSLYSSENEIFAGSSKDGFYTSTNFGNTWAQQELLEWDIAAITANARGRLFAAAQFASVWTSTDGGQTWVQGGFIPGNNVASLCINRNDDALAGSFGIYHSTDEGVSWILVGLSSRYVRSIVRDSLGRLLAGTSRYGVYRSFDDGNNWTQTSLQGVTVTGLGVDPNGAAFAGTDSSGLFSSTDWGNTWVSTNFPSLNVASLCINSLGHLFVASRTAGIFRSTDHGVAWTDISSGLSNLDVRCCIVDASGFAYLGTYGDGVFRSVEPTLNVTEPNGQKPALFSLLQNYPNPVNPSTRIRYGLPYAAFVRLTIYNTLGQEIIQLVNEYQPPGYHEATFRADAIASGIYFYRLQAGSYIQTRKMVILR